MKKLITLLLVLTGMVSTASAATFTFGLEIANVNTSNVKVYRYGSDGADTWDAPGQASYLGLKYGRYWFSIDLNGQPNAIVRLGSGDDDSSDNIVGINASSYYYISSDKNGGSSDNRYNVGTVDNPFTWQHMTCRNNIVGYSVTEDNMTNKGNSKFTYEMSKETIGSNTVIYFRFRQGDFVPLKDDGGSLRCYPEIHPKENNALLDMGSSTTNYYQAESTQWVWKIQVPTYDFEKIVLTAEYGQINGYQWKISADAYITKTVSAENKYATFGCSVPLEVEESFVQAWTLIADAASGKITKKSIVSMIPAGQGVLLVNETGSDKTVRYKVSSTDFNCGANDLVATDPTTLHVDQTANDGYTNYILAKEGTHVGFYKVNGTSGNDMLANTAYLHVADASGTRSFFALDDSESVTAINAVEQGANANCEFFNIAGQRVAQPTKGLYIVNGKKVIIK